VLLLLLLMLLVAVAVVVAVAPVVAAAAAAALTSPGDALQTATTTTTTTLCCSPIQSTHRQGRCEGVGGCRKNPRGVARGQGCSLTTTDGVAKGFFFKRSAEKGDLSAGQEGLLRG